MPKRRPGDPLNHLFILSIKKPGIHGDGYGSKGLKLVVRPRAKEGLRKSWIQRIQILGNSHEIGLGSFPDVLLAEARVMAVDNWERSRQGEDIRLPPPTVPTVAKGFEGIIEPGLCTKASNHKPVTTRLVRRHLWMSPGGFSMSRRDSDSEKVPAALYDRLTDTPTYAARMYKVQTRSRPSTAVARAIPTSRYSAYIFANKH